MTSTDELEIGSQKVKNLRSGETVEISSFWKNDNVAIIFFRRWGCMFCRLWAKELSEISPILKENNIKVIGVGVEEEGAKDFIDGNYIDADLYCVESQYETYEKLGFKRFNMMTILTSLIWKQSRDAISKGKSMGLTGDLKGDWVQVGGALLVERGGKVLKHFKQTGPADHLPNQEILKYFGLETEFKSGEMGNASRENLECNTEERP